MKRLKPLLKPLPPRLGFAVGDTKGRDRQREKTLPWRHWYHSKRWQDLRMKILVRDLFTCQQTGVLLTGKYPLPNSPVVDHINRHHGDEALFWDESNLQAVSKEYHDSQKAREDHQKDLYS